MFGRNFEVFFDAEHVCLVPWTKNFRCPALDVLSQTLTYIYKQGPVCENFATNVNLLANVKKLSHIKTVGTSSLPTGKLLRVLKVFARIYKITHKM